MTSFKLNYLLSIGKIMHNLYVEIMFYLADILRT